MKKESKIILTIAIMIVIYLVVVNVFSELIRMGIVGESQEVSYSDGTKVGFQDSVSIQVTRTRWYGKIIEDGQTKNVYLFGLIRIPTMVENHKFIGFNISFLLILLIITYSINKFGGKDEVNH